MQSGNSFPDPTYSKNYSSFIFKMKVNPPFRADHVGSLLRPRVLLEKRNAWKMGQLSAEALRAAEDVAIAETIKRVEAIGIKAVTDGEFRRDYFHLDFLKQLDGVTVTGGIAANPNAKVAEDGFVPPKLSVTGKLRHARNIQVDDFNFLKSFTTQTPKVSIPSPTMIHFRGGRKSIDITAYPDMDEFFVDLAAAYRAEIAALYAAGCRYIQLDDTNLAYLCDPKMRDAARERGEDPDQLPRTYAALINSVIDNRPADLTVGIHLCRGNYRSTWFAEGGYEPVAEVLFNDLNVDAYFLEYDDERSGDFAPLRFVPKHKTVVLGIISSKIPTLETTRSLTKRIHEAAQYMPLENMCISPQCGFSSTSHGNAITEAVQWKKLELTVKTAQKIWG
jgi:5-methyltetrahydropteroyltriglutamate--homocysteine methyltransferase